MAQVCKSTRWLYFYCTQTFFLLYCLILRLVKKNGKKIFFLFLKNKVINYKSLEHTASRINIFFLFLKKWFIPNKLNFSSTYIILGM